jgi:hypothetical protein
MKELAPFWICIGLLVVIDWLLLWGQCILQKQIDLLIDYILRRKG